MSYVKPVKGAAIRRLDQGIDYQGKPGEHVVAMGLARVDAVKPNPGGFGQVVYYTLLTGPMKGRQIYVGHAQPLVHNNQIVQAGEPVATLLEHSLGNAHNLSGWTEIGFASGGTPASGDEKDTRSAKQFLAFVKQAGAAKESAAPVDVGNSGGDTSGGAAAPTVQIPQPGAQPQIDTSPAPAESLPYEPPPGSGINSASAFAADTWTRIASQAGADPESQLLAQNAQTAGG